MFIMKMDLEKAYDRIEWSFVADTLIEVGLPREMIRLIMSYISSGQFKLLWNGMATEIIQTSGSLGQGDHIFSCLFVLCMER